MKGECSMHLFAFLVMVMCFAWIIGGFVTTMNYFMEKGSHFNDQKSLAEKRKSMVFWLGLPLFLPIAALLYLKRSFRSDFKSIIREEK